MKQTSNLTLELALAQERHHADEFEEVPDTDWHEFDETDLALGDDAVEDESESW